MNLCQQCSNEVPDVDEGDPIPELCAKCQAEWDADERRAQAEDAHDAEMERLRMIHRRRGGY